VADYLRTVRIVEAEDRGLHPGVRGPEAGGVIGIPFDLGRAAHVTLDEHAVGVAADRHGRGEEDRFARDEPFRLADVGDDLLRGTVAGSQPAEGHRSSHQLDEIATVDAALECQRPRRELRLDGLLEVLARQFVEALPVLVGETGTEPCEIEFVGFGHG